MNTGDQRVSNTGAVFTRDTSNPDLGEAYSDPSGIIWGSIVTVSPNNTLNHYDALKYCRARRARLPTKEEFEQLAKYLGEGTAQRYSPFLADGKTDLLPGLSNHSFWSSSIDPKGSKYAYYFSNLGYVAPYPYDRGSKWNFAVRCVVGM